MQGFLWWPLLCVCDRCDAASIVITISNWGVLLSSLPHCMAKQSSSWSGFAKKDDEIKLEIGNGEGRKSQQSASNSTSRSFSKREASISKISQAWYFSSLLTGWEELAQGTKKYSAFMVCALCMQYCYPEAAACNARKGASHERLLLVHNPSGHDQQS